MSRTASSGGWAPAERRRAVLTLTGGVVCLVVSFVVQSEVPTEGASQWRGWFADLLLNVGAALLIFAGIEFLSVNLLRRVQDVDARQTEAIAQVRESSEAAMRDLDRRVSDLAELSQRVASAVHLDREREAAAFERIRREPTHAVILDALHRALGRELVPDRGVRVPIGEGADFRLNFRAELADVIVKLDIEDIDGARLQGWRWSGATDQVDLLKEIALACADRGEAVAMDTTFVFARLSETIVLADSDVELRPIVEYCPPQWAVTSEALVSTDGRHYRILHDRPDRASMDVHVKTKTWLEHESYDLASQVADYLYPRPTPVQ